MINWREVKLSKILKENGYIRGPFGSALKRNEMEEHGIPVYEQMHAIYNNRDFRFFINDKKFNELKRFQVHTDDLIISCSGTYGKISIIKNDDPKGIISQALLILRPNPELVYLKYLYYYLTSKQGFELITQASHGSVQINIAPRKTVENIPLLLPPLKEQKAIASVLSSLDDKIDLLHRQNQTLESLAETIFYNIVISKAKPSQSKHLFELGDLKNGVNYSRNEIGDSNFALINVRDVMKEKFLPNKQLEIIRINKLKAKPYLLEKGDILIVRSASPGEVSLIIEDCINVLFSGFIIRFRLNEKNLIYATFLNLLRLKRQMDAFSEGTTLKNLTQTILKNIRCFIPGDAEIDKLNSMVGPLFTKIFINNNQIRTLQTLRDTLLPKLMSGEVRVKYNEDEVEKVV